MLTVIAEIRTRPGAHHRAAVLDVFKELVPVVLAETGCHGYAPMVSSHTQADFQSAAPDSVVMIEKWDNIAALQAHLATPHMQAFREQVKDHVLDIQIKVLQDAF